MQMPRDPFSTVRVLSDYLLRLRPSVSYTVNAISEGSQLHWETVDRFLEIISFCQNKAPLIQVRNVSEKKVVTIVGLPRLMQLEPEMRIMAQMYMQGAISPANEVGENDLFLTGEEKGLLVKLTDAGYIQRSERGCFLTPLGVHAILDDVAKVFEQYQMSVREEEDGKRQIEDVTKKMQETPLADLRETARLILSPRAKKILADSFGIKSPHDLETVLRSNLIHFFSEPSREEELRADRAADIRVHGDKTHKMVSDYMVILNRNMALEFTPIRARGDPMKMAFLVSRVMRLEDLKELPHQVAHFEGKIRVEEETE